MIKQTIIISFLSITIFSCRKDHVNYKVVDNAAFKDSLVQNAADTLTLGNKKFVLVTYLIRDFFPQCPPDGRPLQLNVTVMNADSSAIPPNIHLNKVYVINGNQTWISSPILTDIVPHFTYPPPDYIIPGYSDGGPKWGPDIFVNVVAEIVDSATGKSYLIRTINQYIVMLS